MIIDSLTNGQKYASLNKHFAAAFNYLSSTDFMNLEPGKHDIVPDELFAILSEYQTKASAGEEMEAHKKYIDIQYIVSGTEKMGVALLKEQAISKSYSDEKDFLLYANAPDYFIELGAGQFVIFYPNDLHLPTIEVNGPATVRKIVMKVSVG
ncbi:MAG: YhcH/YjgK/YiaL family protein [Chitinophagaceae bacterium]